MVAFLAGGLLGLTDRRETIAWNDRLVGGRVCAKRYTGECRRQRRHQVRVSLIYTRKP
ncbi:hypothetical protein FB566_1675 [Stackebrandtia endophytica]|uniref:Uncharacterized protein n=1 Tax=Stackebrandtia endophytica TaxID=1496996 RepID=A0A543AU91_9ACTN|nr:hypothetical protein [Stackebrandtia endophytica]TQL76154.1 hypothetical protein FB566_1675 [Stackebrandtia endophytica]